MKTRTLVMVGVAALIFLMGCSTSKDLYKWHDYDSNLFKYYQKPETAEAFRAEMETAVQEVEKSKGKIAPGLCAEIGTLYLQKGDRASAVTWYKKERDIWPDSAAFMGALITNLEGKTREGN